MTEPVQLSITILDADTEISGMHMLSQVMQHLHDHESMTEQERQRIAAWFGARYGYIHLTTGKES
jgi:hypothetical protein